ncbi:MAG TPA: glycosyltransferase 87 family protein, partial [Solirubrobacterales bacterium]
MTIDPGLAFGLVWAGFLAYLGFLAAAPRLDGRLVWGTIVVCVAGFALAPVLLSHDVYSYVDYARLGVRHGLDPYVNPPLAAPQDPAYAEVTWTETTSAYGPLFTLVTYPLAWLPVGVAVAVLKAVAGLSVLGIAAIVSRLAPARSVDPHRAAAFVALNPLVLVHVVGGAHNDGVTMLLAMLAVAAILNAREFAAGAALTAAIATKAAATFIAPFALIGTTAQSSPVPFWGIATRRNRRGGARLLLGGLAAAFGIGAAAFLAFGWDWLSGLGLAGENQSRTSYMSIPITTARLTGLDPDAVRLAAGILFAATIAYLLAWTWRGNDWIRAAAWAALALLLATAWLLPWYLIWVLPLAAISRDRPLQLLTLALT